MSIRFDYTFSQIEFYVSYYPWANTMPLPDKVTLQFFCPSLSRSNV
jgi:hypothetical protein